MKTSNHQLEDELIRKCVGQFVGMNNSSDIALLIRNQINWDIILPIAIHHRVAPMLYNQLIPQYKEYVPEDAQSGLKEYCSGLVGRNLYMTGNLFKILELFKENDINAIPVKGPITAETLYGGVGFRSFCDLDILVSKHDAVKARDLLSAQGYVPDIRPNPDEENLFLEYENFFSLLGNKSGVSVDLHWELSGLYNLMPITLEMLGREIVTAKLCGKEVVVLSDEMNLIHTCIHASSHCWQHLEFIACVTAILHNDKKLDWQKLVNLAQGLRCHRMLLLGLSLAVDLFHADIPAEIKHQISCDRQLKEMSSKIISSLFEEGGEGQEHQLSWRFSLLHIKIRDSFFDKCKYAVRLFFRPTVAELRDYSLPRKFGFLYYLIRPLRLIWGGVRLLFKKSTSSGVPLARE